MPSVVGVAVSLCRALDEYRETRKKRSVTGRACSRKPESCKVVAGLGRVSK